MYRLMIVDDEQIVLDSMRFIIEKNFKDVAVVGTARSGREAIEKAENLNPEIILMDIKMPGINGLEAIREIKSRFRHMVFIILTAFEQFDFAKEAVNLGVIEYLLKPVNRVKVIETVKKAVEIIQQERDKRMRELELREKLETILPVLENGFIYSVIFFDDNSKELESYRQVFELGGDGGYIMTLEFGEEERGRLGNRIGLSVKSQQFYSFFRETLKARGKCIVGPVMLNRVVVFVPSTGRNHEYSRRIEAVALAEEVLSRLPQRVDADFCIGIGRSYTSLEDLSKSYDESLKAIQYAGSKGVMHYMDIPAEENAEMEYPVHRERFLLEKVRLGDTGGSIDAFQQLFGWLETAYGNQPLKIKNKLLEILFLAERLAWDYGMEGEKFDKHRDYLEELLSIHENSQLKAWGRQELETITNGINGAREKRISSLALKAREFIDRNYSREINLEDVSREVNISPHYFSKLFKEETGENFIDYLTNLRMDKAREFLEEGQLTVKEVCFKVGYGDPNYFSRIFKKTLGVTPSEYRENIQKNTVSG